MPNQGALRWQPRAPLPGPLGERGRGPGACHEAVQVSGLDQQVQLGELVDLIGRQGLARYRGYTGVSCRSLLLGDVLLQVAALCHSFEQVMEEAHSFYIRALWEGMLKLELL